MARRGGGSSVGLGLMVVVGGLIWVVNGVYQFLAKNPFVIVVLAAVAILFFLIRRRSKRLNTGTVSAGAKLPASSETPRSSSQPVSCRADARWVAAGEAIDIQDVKISAGLFYVGTGLAIPGRISTQYVLNARLLLHKTERDLAGATMPYWPSYETMTPAARSSYLLWMADGRRDPRVGIGHVFLFFYGLEHRLFIDEGFAFANVAIAEVERLLTIYGGNQSFSNYAGKFLAAARWLAGVIPNPPPLSPDLSRNVEVPTSILVYLADKLSKSPALTADDALLWSLSLPDTYLRTPAVRCFIEFVALWRLRYAQKFPSGFQIRLPSQQLQMAYQAASGTFTVNVPARGRSLVDVSSISNSLKPLEQLIQICTDDLDAYSRFVGRYPDKAATTEAALMLPSLLQDAGSNEALRKVARRIDGLLNGANTVALPFRQLLEVAAIDSSTGKLSKSLSEQLGKAFDRAGVAFEPDNRYGSGGAQLDDVAVIFRADNGGPIDPAGSAYQRLKVQVEVAALAAASDGSVETSEIQKIIAKVNSATDVQRIERLRLIAFAVAMFKSPPKLERVMRKISSKHHQDREAIAAAAVSVVASSGKVEAKEVRFVERLHEALGLPKEQAYTALHRVESDEPVSVSQEKRVAGIALPVEPSPMPTSAGIHIDPARLEKIQKQTQQVSSILANIFNEDDVTEAPATAVVNANFNGLDSSHAELLRYIEVKGSISRGEFDLRAKQLKLLPNGAIERINEWSFDRFDEPLLEDGDTVVVSPELKPRLAELLVGA